jgi:hypothetical protein
MLRSGIDPPDPAGTVAAACNLPDWEAPFALRDVRAAALGTRVRIGNDVQVATDARVRARRRAAVLVDPRRLLGHRRRRRPRARRQAVAGPLRRRRDRPHGRARRWPALSVWAARLHGLRRTPGARAPCAQAPRKRRANEPLPHHGEAWAQSAGQRRVGAGALRGQGSEERESAQIHCESGVRRGGWRTGRRGWAIQVAVYARLIRYHPLGAPGELPASDGGASVRWSRGPGLLPSLPGRAPTQAPADDRETAAPLRRPARRAPPPARSGRAARAREAAPRAPRGG